MRRYRDLIINIAAPLAMFVILFGGWQLFVMAFKVPVFLLPGPVVIIQRMIEDYNEIIPHFIVSFQTVMVAFVFAVTFGIMFAFVITNYSLLNSILSPFIILAVTTPLITLMPLLMIAFGFGTKVRMLAVFIQAFPIVNMNAATGYLNTPNIRLELMKSLGASKLQTFKEAVFPSAIVDVFTGVKLCAIFSVTATIGVEFSSSSEGLGSRILYYTDFYKADLAFACIFYVAIIGVFLYSAVLMAEKLIVKWKI